MRRKAKRKDKVESEDKQDSLCTSGKKRRNRDRKMQTHSSSGTYNLDHNDMNGGEELEMIALSRKPFRGLSCTSNVRMKVEPQNDREVLSRILCVKLTTIRVN